MAVIYEIKNRTVLPNWRDYKRTVKLGELEAINSASELKFNIQNDIEDWKSERNLGTASEVLNASYVSQTFDFPELDEVISFIKKNNKNISSALLGLANKIEFRNAELNETKQVELEIQNFEEFKSFSENHLVFKILKRTKNLTISQPRNSIIWVELARLYTIIGLEEKALRAITVALNLTPNNRFVLRSATRFFAHIGDFSRALFYLRKSPATKFDPWLISAHIAASHSAERNSNFTKIGRDILNSKGFHPKNLTELSSSLGTLEFYNGSVKKGRNYIEQSLSHPNDNSLAQVEWLSKKESTIVFDSNNFLNVPNSFEALALDKYNRSDWHGALKESINWFLDSPYSKRPILHASHIASIFLKDDETAIALTKAGLNANPNDPTLLNNIVYSYMLSNDFKGADEYLKRLASIDISKLEVESKISLQATLGLVAFRSGETLKGEQLYEIAIENSERANNKFYRDLAKVNYLRELALQKDPNLDKIKTILSTITEDKNEQDIELIKDEVLTIVREKNNL